MTILKPDEKDVKREVKKLLDKYSWFHFMPPANTYGSGGISDHLAIKYGIFLAVEAKHGSGAKGGMASAPMATPLQRKFQRSVRDAGGYAVVVNERTLHVLEDTLKAIELKHGARPLTQD